MERKNINEDCYTKHLRLTGEWDESVDAKIRKEIHRAGEFELYFGVPETPERLMQFTTNQEQFFSIYERETGAYIGYLGLFEHGEQWELEIYIFQQYRNQGYGTEALYGILFSFFAGLLSIDKSDRIERIQPEEIEATVRKENMASCRMLEKIGFRKDESLVGWLVIYPDEEDDDNYSKISIARYTLTKQELFYR